jgi:hypothetical protein
MKIERKGDDLWGDPAKPARPARNVAEIQPPGVIKG